MVDNLISDAMADALRHHHPPRADRHRSAGHRSRRVQPADGTRASSSRSRSRRQRGASSACDSDRMREAIDNLMSATPSNTARSAVASPWWSMATTK
ncbi:MAG: hypothetical protein MZV49_20375 [Rhodopseudomonas palustris]|nr:hypothetical protein [Rhodopseudomonas palustris]